jgi:ABC-2 type transport system ATP-binding protein
MIELIDFTKNYYSPFQKDIEFSVKNINFKVLDNSITVILGANGSGKSSILKAIAGFHYATSGQIYISNTSIEDTQLALKETGYVPELPLLPLELTVLEYLDFCYKSRSLDIKLEADILKNIINLCSLKDVLNKKIKKLSKGYLQRTSLAQALIHNPKNLVLDEPFSGLDPTQIIHMRSLIKELSKTKAILLSTHIFQEASLLADDILIISKGILKAHGTEQELLKQTVSESFENAYLKITEA